MGAEPPHQGRGRGKNSVRGAPVPSPPPRAEVTYRLHFVFDELHNIMFHDGILLESIKSIERSI